MRKLIILFLSLVIGGCSSAPKTNPLYSDYEIQGIEELFENPILFDYPNAPEFKSYTLDEHGVTLNFSGAEDFLVQFTLDPTYIFTYPFEDKIIHYVTSDGEERSTTLSSSYKKIGESSEFSVFSTLVDNDQVFDIYFKFDYENPNESKIYTLNNHEKIIFTDSLNSQLITTYRQQWNEAILFHDTIQRSFAAVNSIFIGPIDNHYDWSRVNEKLFYDSFQKGWIIDDVPIIQPTYVNPNFYANLDFHNFAINNIKLRNTLLLLYFLPDSFDQNNIPDFDILAAALTSNHPDYQCWASVRCHKPSGSSFPIYAYQGLSFPLNESDELASYSSNLLFEESFVNHVNDLFGTDYSSTIDETRLLESGVVQSKEEHYYIAIDSFTDGLPWEYHRLLILDYSIDNDRFSFDIILLNAPLDQKVWDNTQQVQYILYDKNNDFLASVPEADIADFILENTSLLPQWSITLQDNDSDLFYTILSATKR